MAEHENPGEGTASLGVDWEVVSLTASAPGPEDLDSVYGNFKKGIYASRESSRTLFMSDHFVFPPSEHENLPIETELSPCAQDENSKFDSAELFDGFESLNLEEQTFHATFHAEASKSNNLYEQEISFQGNLKYHGEHIKGKEEDKTDKLNHPCEAWWKRRAVALYCRAKEGNALWSFAVAAAITGLVVLGRRCQRDNWQLHQLKMQFAIGGEIMSRMLKPFGRFQDTLRIAAAATGVE